MFLSDTPSRAFEGMHLSGVFLKMYIDIQQRRTRRKECTV